MPETRALISGASIAGPALAYWLNRYGFDDTLVEKAGDVRPGGQAVDFKGPTHRTVLQRMGVLAEIERGSVADNDGAIVNAAGRKIGVVPGAFSGEEINIPRGYLARTHEPGRMVGLGGSKAPAFFVFRSDPLPNEAKFRGYASVSQKTNAGHLLAPRTRLGILARNLLFAGLKVSAPLMKLFDRPAKNITLEDYADPSMVTRAGAALCSATSATATQTGPS